MKTIDPERVRELLAYDPDTGVFTWRVSRGWNAKAGSVAGRIDGRGYAVIRIDSIEMNAHRIAWAYVYGAVPEAFIDHINGVRSDNRIVNLRLATHSENQQNQRAARSNSKTGYLGVRQFRDKFRAGISVNGKFIHLGLFKDPYSAHQAYIEAKRVHHPYGQI